MISPEKYVSRTPPLVRAFDAARDLETVEDYMTACRRAQFIIGDSPEYEFVTVEYEIHGIRDVLNVEVPERIYLNVLLVVPAGKQLLHILTLAGVDPEGRLWLERYGGWILMTDEMKYAKEVRAEVDAQIGDPQKFLEDMVRRMQRPPDEGEEWKRA